MTADTEPVPWTFAARRRRSAAYAVDATILGVASWAIGLMAGETLAPVGTPARYLVFALFVAYFGILGSRVGRGQTLGKRLLGITVAGSSAAFVSVPRALVRAGLLGLPFLFNGYNQLGFALRWLAMFGTLGGGALFFMFLSNERTRQSVHDVLVGTYVVDVGKSAPALPHPTPPEVVRIARRWIAFAFAGATILTFATALPVLGRFVEITEVSDPWALDEALKAIPGLTSYQIKRGEVIDSRGVHYALELKVFYSRKDSDEEVARRSAAAAFEHIPSEFDAQHVKVEVVRGWDLGFASMTRSRKLTISR
jgi:uncharacterized RDD family membrane protein YckC